MIVPYQEREKNGVRCRLCEFDCLVEEGGFGRCKVKKNVAGNLISLSYSKFFSKLVIPVEDIPLFHFFPGAKFVSLSMPGCNLNCKICPYPDVARHLKNEFLTFMEELSVDELVDDAIGNKVSGFVFSYGEPFVNFETLLDFVPILKSEGFLVGVKTNGFFKDSLMGELDLDFYVFRLVDGSLWEKILPKVEISFMASHVEVEVPILVEERIFKDIAKINEEIPVHVLDEQYVVAKKYLVNVYSPSHPHSTGKIRILRFPGKVKVISTSGYGRFEGRILGKLSRF